MKFRAAVLHEQLTAAGLPVANAAVVPPTWTRPLDADEQARADAILADFAGLPDVLDDARVRALRDAGTRRAWQDGLEGAVDLRPLLVVARRLFQLVKSQHPGLTTTFPEFVVQVKADLARESVPARAAARARSNP